MPGQGADDSAARNLPVPDPSILTTESLLRAVSAERDYVDGQLDVLRERLRAIDVATRLLNETVNRTPTDITKEITHLRELSEEKFRSVEKQFGERDTRSERESKDNKVAVDAAFAAQKEAAAKQDEGNLKAIDKSERATAETIKTNAELSATRTDAIAGVISDLKERVVKIETAKSTTSDNRTERRSDMGLYILAASVLIAALGLILMFHK